MITHTHTHTTYFAGSSCWSTLGGEGVWFGWTTKLALLEEENLWNVRQDTTLTDSDTSE